MDYAQYSAGKAAYYSTSVPRNTFAAEGAGGERTHGYQYSHVAEVVHYVADNGRELVDVSVADRLISIVGQRLAAVADALIDQQLVRLRPCVDPDDSDGPIVEVIVVTDGPENEEGTEA